MMTTVRYSVWIHFDDIESDTEHDAATEAFNAIPGFIESSWEDSYDDD